MCLLLYTIGAAFTSQECMDDAGSLNNDGLNVANRLTFIFADPEYQVDCERIVVAWEFCYRMLDNAPAKPVIFFPGIWMPNETNGTLHYTLIQSNHITFTPAQIGSTTNSILCPRVNLSKTDQFTAPAGSVVGMFSYIRRNEPIILRTNKGGLSITTYRFDGNQSSVQVANDSDIDYNIALKAHFGRYLHTF